MHALFTPSLPRTVFYSFYKILGAFKLMLETELHMAYKQIIGVIYNSLLSLRYKALAFRINAALNKIGSSALQPD